MILSQTNPNNFTSETSAAKLNLRAPIVAVSDLSVTFSEKKGVLRVLRNVNFNIQPHEFICLIGPSGSGKSTLLRVLAGLLPPTRGSISFPHSSQPTIGVVFQDANLLPWRNVLKNITLPLEIQGVEPALAEEKALALIHLTNLQGFEHSMPQDLSGGMAQRVAIARALIQQPDILLMDEPFGSLDALTREKMSAELLSIWQAQRNTVLMVTHSISEAILLSDRVLVISPRPGRITLDLQIELPRPRNEDMRYTAPFGEMANVLRAAIQS